MLITFAIAGAIFHDISRERHDNLMRRMETTVDLLANSRNLPVRELEQAIAELDQLPEEKVLSKLRARWSKGDDGKSLSLAYALAKKGTVDVSSFLISQIAAASPDEVDNLAKALVWAFDNDNNKSLSALKIAAEKTERAAEERTAEREAETALAAQGKVSHRRSPSGECRIVNRHVLD